MIPASQKIQHPQRSHEAGPAALVVAHPGHELRIHAWLERTCPHVFVLTDGSGHASEARLDATAGVLDRAGAKPGPIFGRFSDREAYRLILEGRLDALQGLTGELADRFVAIDVLHVVSDAVEGFNPVHDLCWVLTESAVEIASRRLNRPIRHFDFPLESAPDTAVEEIPKASENGSLEDGGLDDGGLVDCNFERSDFENGDFENGDFENGDFENGDVENGDFENSDSRNTVIRYALDDAAWKRKLDEAWANEQLRFEVERAIEHHGSQAFRVEVLRPASREALEALLDHPPYYETYGEQRVRAGAYDRVLRFREHFLPLAEAIKTWAKTA